MPVETAGPRALRVPRHRPLGQSLVEFALVAPVMLLLTLTALDFGRIYLGWINLQSAVRAATNYAANNAEAWLTPSDPESVTTITAYRNQVINDTANTNCVLTPGVPADPTFADGNGDGTTTDIGDRATVALTCTFGVITPVISNILGSGINVSASAEFPVKTGQFATAVGSAPVASFTASPTSTTTGTQIAFTDTSSGSPTTWAWSFGDGATSSIQNPTHPYGTPGTYTVELTVTSAYGASTVTQTNYITINAPAPVADFTANITNPTVGDPVSFTDTSTGNPTAWEWTFGDGGSISGSANVAHTYNTPGTYSVTLKVTAASGSNTVTKTNYIVVSAGTCRVPTFNGTSSANAQTTWNTAGFTTTVQFKQGGLPWTIQSQDVVALSSAPCNTVITVSRN
ncbi:MAG TPA: PKD domain-containing protein [Candidatus Limnocylindrales bacterium]|nr:PKD domain-containing protein [Candidatus Limnocylindrales bacterium]